MSNYLGTHVESPVYTIYYTFIIMAFYGGKLQELIDGYAFIFYIDTIIGKSFIRL